MKPSLSKRIRISFCAIVALTAFIFGCKKEILTSSEKSLTLSDPKIIDAKSWYDKSYPKNGQKPATRVLNSTGETEMDLSQIIKPDWNEAKSYMRFDDDVVEMPLDSNTKLEMKNNSLTNSPNYSKSSILLLKQGEAYSAFVMTIIGDADYINGDASKISKNTYSKRDQDFSGFIYYSTPKGKFVSGWYYRKGVAISRLEKKDHSKSVNSIQNQSVSGLKTNLVSSYQVCTDWYQFGTDENGNFWSYYLDTTCITVIVDNQNNPPTGGGGSGGSGGGGGGNPGTGNPPRNPNPCIPSQVESVGGKTQKINDLKINTYYDPGQGGFPPPTGNPCSSEPHPIFGLNNSNAVVPDEVFDAFLEYAESLGFTINDPVNDILTVDGVTYTGQVTTLIGPDGSVLNYFSPDVNAGPFQTGREYNIGRGSTAGAPSPSTNYTISGLNFGTPISGSIIYIPSGGSGGTGITITTSDIGNAIPVIDSQPGINPTTYINCFNDGKTAISYTLTIFVDQPSPGTNHQWSTSVNVYGANLKFMTPGGQLLNVGHTFVSFEKNNTDGTSVKQTMGFYPGGAGISSKAVIKDDSNHPFNISYKLTVTSGQFNAALNRLMQDYNSSNYVLSNLFGTERNCTDAAISWMTVAGAYLPTQSRGSFSNTPGDFGQVLKNLSTASTIPGTAPQSHGPCY